MKINNQKLINLVSQEIVNEYPNGNFSIDDVIEKALEEVCFDNYRQETEYDKYINNEDFILDVTDRVFDILTD